jgi:hypothetical protein
VTSLSPLCRLREKSGKNDPLICARTRWPRWNRLLVTVPRMSSS